MKKYVFSSLLLSSFLFAEGTYSGIFFTDYEENATLYLVNYYDYTTLKRILNNSTTTNNILKVRLSSPYTSITQLDNTSGVSKRRLNDLRLYSHILDWSNYTSDLGLTLHQENFLYGLTGILIGFSFLLIFILVVVL